MKKLLLLCLLTSYSLFATAIESTFQLDRSIILQKKQDIYLLVTFSVDDIKIDKRTPVNLSLVLDRSGSMMAKGKLKYAQSAAKYVIDNLSKIDWLSIVEYDHRVTLLWPSSPVVAKGLMKLAVNSLFPRGSTNLTGGMVKGAQETLRHFDSKIINRVILLSDGLANEGVTDPKEIEDIVREYKQQGISISTMGLGLNYNEDLMQTIAQVGGGKYYYIESPTQMASIFAEEMSSIFKTVAKNVKLEFQHSKAIKSVKLFGYPYESNGLTTTIKLENFYASEKRIVLFKLQIDPSQEGNITLGEFNFSYLDNLKNKQATLHKKIALAISKSIKDINVTINQNVQSEALMVEAEIEHKKYLKMYQEGKKELAKKNIADLSKRLEVANQTIGNVQLEKKVEALSMEKEEMDEADKNFANRSNYLKMSKQRLYNSMKGKRGKIVQQLGDRGYDVKRLQKVLKEEKLYRGVIDGIYSKELEDAVKAFQKQNKIKVDGVAGPRTLKKLELY